LKVRGDKLSLCIYCEKLNSLAITQSRTLRATLKMTSPFNGRKGTLALASNRPQNTLAAHYPGVLLYHTRGQTVTCEKPVCGKPLGFKQRAAFPAYARGPRVRADYGTPVIITLYALRSVKNDYVNMEKLSRGGFYTSPEARRRWSQEISRTTDFCTNCGTL